MRLKDKVAIITGAGQTPGETMGNGRATALLFTKEGARCLIVDIDEESLGETAAIIADAGGECEVCTADVSLEQDCERIASQCVDTYGRLDILHNNVGIGGGDASVTSLELDVWQKIMDVNLTSMYLMCKHALPQMRRQESGAINNISSVAAIASTAMMAYKISKAGVMALTQHVAMGNAKYGIRANCILPGLMNTPMAVEGFSRTLNKSREEIIAMRNARVPLGSKMGTADDVAFAALFLASDEAKFITGVNLPVDGGQSLRVG